MDADEKTWNIDVTKIEEKITPRTKAIMPVHIFGNPCDMDAIQNIADAHNLFVIEDAAEAHGAEYYTKMRVKLVPPCGTGDRLDFDEKKGSI